MHEKNLLIWGIFLGITAVSAYWHIKENNYLSRQWREHFDDHSAQWLIRFAWSRSVQLLLALACCTAIIIAYDWQLGETRSSLEESLKHASEQEQELADIDIDIQKSTDEQRKPMPEPPPVSAPIRPSPMEEVYNPEETTTGSQSAMDGLKKRYEEILVSYFFLKRCDKIPASDYHIIISALSQEMASINAPGRLQYDILTAAQGSYKEMYTRNACDSDDVAVLHRQYGDYISALSKNFAAQ